MRDFDYIVSQTLGLIGVLLLFVILPWVLL
jgi:hypothetical protein